MDISDFFIVGVKGKDLNKLENALGLLPENFVNLKCEEILSNPFDLSVSYFVEDSSEANVKISIFTSFPEKFTLNLPLEAVDLTDYSKVDIHGKQSFDVGGVHYFVENSYSAFTT
jgi:hypothetical protein